MQYELSDVGRGRIEYFARELVLKVAASESAIYRHDHPLEPAFVGALWYFCKLFRMWDEFYRWHSRLRPFGQPLSFVMAQVIVTETNAAVQIPAVNVIGIRNMKNALRIE